MDAMFQTSSSISFLNFNYSDLFRISRFEFRFLVGTFSLLLGLAGGCASAPSHFYTLSASGATPKDSSDVSVAVGPVSIPAVVDRPQIVVSIGPNQVRLEEFDRWALPLQNNIARVIAENLTVQLGTPRVTVFPELTSMDADYRAIIDVQRFDSVPGEAATLEALWIVRRMKDAKAERGRTVVREAVQTKDYEALAAGHSRAVARLSRDIADAVGALAHGAQ